MRLHTPDESADQLPEINFFYDRNDPAILYRIGLQLQVESRREEAVAFLARAALLDPENAAIRNSMGNLFLALRQWDKAEQSLRHGLELDPNHKEILNNLGLVCKVKGDFDQAAAHYRKALAVDPDFMQAQDNLDFLYQNVVPSWHFSMMHDALRNEAYDRAITKAVKPGSLVFEIGTGAGLLAMMAARAGAERVITTEMIPSIAATAQEIVRLNGYDDRITVLGKKSGDVLVGEDLPRQADLLITETFDAGFLGEEAVPSIQHARDILIKPDAQIIPRAGTVFAALLESRALWEECAVDRAAGFDLGPFNKFRENVSGKYVQNYPYRRLTGDVELFHFDFTGDPIQAESKNLVMDIQQSGTAHALIYWFRLFLDDEVILNTNIEDKSCWRVAVQTLDPPLPVTAGDGIPVRAQHNNRWIKLRLQP